MVQRQRVFGILNGKLGKPIVWVSSPAGSGKTTLVSSYLDSRKLPCIWYQCDEGDSDLATFFYYMGLAAKKAVPRYKQGLPLLTREYLAGIPTFTRRYFEQLYHRLATRYASRTTPHGFFIVLDNYQDVPAGSPFHDMIANGFDGVPEGVHIVVISRNDPPTALARLQANGRINVLEYSEIRFTFKESRELVRGHIPQMNNQSIKEIHENTEGWPAGIVLMLERARLDGVEALLDTDAAYGRVFDYFAGEIFEKTEKGVQEFLLQTAFLPSLNVPLAEGLTGEGLAGFILSNLNRQNYFTEKLSGGRGYRYHPLFRDYLMSRAKTFYRPEKLATLRRKAAQLLEGSGQIEGAARLYLDAGEGQHLARMVIDHAREFLRQGRNKTVAEWIAGIPGGTAGGNPWLLYWEGMCFFPFDIPRARDAFERAFSLFRNGDDAAGQYLSWAGIVDTYVFDLDDWKHLDDCIAVFDDLRSAYPSFPSSEIDLIASSRMLICLTLRKTNQPQKVDGWLEFIPVLLQKNPSVDIQTDTVFCMSIYYLWKGEYQKNEILLERAETEILNQSPAPFAAIRIKMMKGIHYWVTAQYEDALRTLSEGLDLAGKNGVHVFDPLLWSFSAAAEMASGNMALAEKSLQNQRTASLSMSKTLDIFFYHINSAWHAMLTGNASLAAEHMETISTKVANMGTPYYRALWHIGMAQVAFLQGRTRDAEEYVQKALRIGLGMKSYVMKWYGLLIDAYLLLQEGKEKEGLLSLRRGLSLGREHGYVHLEFYQPSVMQFLYARALAEGIEPEYVKGLIRKLDLTPPLHLPFAASASFLECWPYPIKIYTLGRFEIIKDGKPLEFTGKVQKKPLEMLKAVIAYGGSNIPVERLTEALWPDADGDLAHKSLEMTMSRLRRLLGGDNFVRYSAGQVSLDLLYCWVDSMVLERVFREIRKSPAGQVVQLCEKAAGLYKGPFLPADTNLPWAIHRHELLKNNLLRAISISGRHYEQTGQWEQAVEFYQQGLDTDHLAEEFYQRLMKCYGKLGRKADAVKTYNRCCSLLRDDLGIDPSAETQAIYSSLQGL
jgi:LuxR family maltose regulon positive regulatory protein